MLRKHSVDAEPCAGSDHPAVGEVPELHLTRPAPAEQRDRIASVA